jgi:hypothetical protein
VIARVRPVTKEDGEGPEATNAVSFDPDDDSIIHLLHKGKPVSFELDKVFSPWASQQDVSVTLCVGHMQGKGRTDIQGETKQCALGCVCHRKEKHGREETRKLRLRASEGQMHGTQGWWPGHPQGGPSQAGFPNQEFHCSCPIGLARDSTTGALSMEPQLCEHVVAASLFHLCPGPACQACQACVFQSHVWPFLHSVHWQGGPGQRRCQVSLSPS